MLTINESAVQAISEYFKTMVVKPLRIYLAQESGGEQLALALSEIGTSDAVVEAGGFQFVMDRALLGKVQPVEVAFAELGFQISANLNHNGAQQGRAAI